MVGALLRDAPAPARVSGASAGALVAACYGAGLGPRELAEELGALERRDFWDPGPGLGVLRGHLFRERLRELLPPTFGECSTPVAVTVHDVLGRRPRALSTGSLPAAVHASCAVPVMFHPVRVGGRLYVDGGLSDRPGLTAMPEGRVLFHHLASRSPWRRPGSESLALPRRPGIVSLVIQGLPRVHPFRLDRGARALALAAKATELALDKSVHDGKVEVWVP